MQIVAYIL